MRMPFVDLNTKEIFNCFPLGRYWYHEQGHLKFNKLESTSILKIFQEYSLWFWMFSITFSLLNKYMLIIAIPMMIFYIGVEIYEEWWCNRYADAMLKKDL